MCFIRAGCTRCLWGNRSINHGWVTYWNQQRPGCRDITPANLSRLITNTSSRTILLFTILLQCLIDGHDSSPVWCVRACVWGWCLVLQCAHGFPGFGPKCRHQMENRFNSLFTKWQRLMGCWGRQWSKPCISPKTGKHMWQRQRQIQAKSKKTQRKIPSGCWQMGKTQQTRQGETMVVSECTAHSLLKVFILHNAY